jgi:surfeit locus 1 family protein
MVFRPLPVLSMLTLLALSLLVWLGNWQLDRSRWKADEISAWQAAQSGPALSLEDVFCHGTEISGQRITIPELPITGANVSVYGRDQYGAAGWRIFIPINLPDCASAQHALIESGFQFSSGQGQSVSEWQADRPLFPGPFSPEPNIDLGQFYAFDAAKMAQSLELDATLSSIAWLSAYSDALPHHLSQTPPERHIGYVVTWFGLALALIGMYVAFHIRLGRLAFRRD